MPDPLSIAASAIALASVALQLLGKERGKHSGNGVGKALSDLELKITNARREELDKLEAEMIDRFHVMGNRISEMGLRQEAKLNELDVEIRLLKQLLTRREK